MGIRIIPTSSVGHLLPALRQIEGCTVHELLPNKDGKHVFPDGEVYVRLDEKPEQSERTIVVHAGAPRPNEGIVELEMILMALESYSIKPELVLTYFPYGMQDKVFEPGEISVAQSLIKQWKDYYQVQGIHVIDAHFHGREWIASYPLTCHSASSLLLNAVQTKYPDIVLRAPDDGSHRRTTLPSAKKVRKNSHEVDFAHTDDFAAAIRGKVVGVVDDLIETGGTLARFADHCRENGAEKVIAIATHGVLPEGVERVKNAYDELYLTNTIGSPHANVDIAPLLASITTTSFKKEAPQESKPKTTPSVSGIPTPAGA